MNSITYQSGYKYQLWETTSCFIPWLPDFETEWLIAADRILTIKRGYAWNGANVIPDCKEIMRGSLVHDALYQAIRLGWLDPRFKRAADRLFKNQCREDGISWAYGRLILYGLRTFGPEDGGKPHRLCKAP
jgi:hypothetical protein